MAEQTEATNTELAKDQEIEKPEDVKQEIAEKDVKEAQDQVEDAQEEKRTLEKQLEDVTLERDDYKLIASHYLPKGVDIDKERGRITRSGDYEPVKTDKPSPERQVVADRKAQPSTEETQAMDKIRQQKRALGLSY